jgi:hypothetical protein
VGAGGEVDSVYQLRYADGRRELREGGYADGVRVDGGGRLKREGGDEVGDWEGGELVGRQGVGVAHGSVMRG